VGTDRYCLSLLSRYLVLTSPSLMTQQRLPLPTHGNAPSVHQTMLYFLLSSLHSTPRASYAASYISKAYDIDLILLLLRLSLSQPALTAMHPRTRRFFADAFEYGDRSAAYGYQKHQWRELYYIRRIAFRQTPAYWLYTRMEAHIGVKLWPETAISPAGKENDICCIVSRANAAGEFKFCFEG
jgi:hypothetical protein